MKWTNTKYSTKISNTTQRINYLLAKYSLKTKGSYIEQSVLPEPDYNQYLDEDPNFLPFYGVV